MCLNLTHFCFIFNVFRIVAVNIRLNGSYLHETKERDEERSSTTIKGNRRSFTLIYSRENFLRFSQYSGFSLLSVLLFVLLFFSKHFLCLLHLACPYGFFCFRFFIIINRSLEKMKWKMFFLLFKLIINHYCL